jgi:putative tricarboxylic transport membrane protein
MKTKIKIFLCLVVVTLVWFGTGFPQAAALEKPEGYPKRNVEIVNPWKAGGSTDMYLRTLSIPLQKILGKKIVIINEVGGEGVKAFQEVISRPADGYTLYAIGPEEIINSVYGRVDYKELAPLARVQMDQSTFWVKAGSPFRTFKDLIDHAKANPNKQIWGGGYGIDHVVTSLITKAAGVEVKYVSYNVGKEATAALLGGHIDVEHEEPGAMISQLEAKMVRPLIILSEERLSRFPDVPTGRELGYDITLGRWRALAARKGTSRQVMQYLAQAVKEAMKSPEYQKLAEKTLLNLRPGFMGPDEFSKFLDQEFVIYDKEMRGLGLVK